MNSFAIYGFVAYYRASGDQRALNAALELFQLLEAKAYDKKRGGYQEFFDEDWTPITDPSQGGIVGAVGTKTYNTHLLECAWLVLDSARALGWSPSILKSWATTLVDYSLEYGYDQTNGGFFYTGPLGQRATDRHKEWWVQSEALVSMLEMYRLTGDAKYFRVFEHTFEFVREHQIAKEGGWWAARNENGTPSGNTARTSMWQGGYHNGRALLQSANLLDAIAADRP